MPEEKKRLPINKELYEAFKEECKLYGLDMNRTVETLIELFLKIQGETK